VIKTDEFYADSESLTSIFKLSGGTGSPADVQVTLSGVFVDDFGVYDDYYEFLPTLRKSKVNKK